MEKKLLNIPYWNQKNLTPPEMISKALICKQPIKISMKLSNLLKDIQSEIETVSESLNTDAALLSRLIYRMKKVFRHDKTLQGMHKVKKCLSNLFSINLLHTIKELNTCTYAEYGPTKEMLQWTMLSFQRLSALLHALVNRCSETVPSLKNKIDSGHHWNIGIVVMGVIARLWLLGRHLCLKSCQWYKDFNEFLGKTMITNENLMLSTHNFPQDLNVWLGNPSFLQEKSNEVLVFSAMVTDESEDVIGEEESIAELGKKESEDDVSSLYFKEDLGKLVTREQLKDFITKRARAEYKDEVRKHGKTAANFAISRKMNQFINLKKFPNKWKQAKQCPYTLGVSTYDLEQRVQNMEKDILFIHLKNEIYENFLRRREPGDALEDDGDQLNPELNKQREKIISDLQSADIKLSSDDLFNQDEEAKAENDTEKELINSFEGSTAQFLSKIVGNEISEICRMAKKGGADQDKRYDEIHNQYDSLEQKTLFIEEGISLIQSMFGEYFERKKRNPDLMVDKRQVLNYLRLEYNRLDKLSRFMGVQSGLIGKQIKEIRDWKSGFTHVTPVDMEMLEVECLLLQDKIEKNHYDFDELKAVLGKSQ